MSYHQTILEPVLLDALRRINPGLPERVLVEAAKRVLNTGPSAELVQENLRLHRLMVDGVKTSFIEDGEERHAHVRLIDWDDQHNDWRAINQFDVVGHAARRPDIVIFLNGMPLRVIELKGVEGQDIEAAFNQVEACKADIPDLFRTTLINVISDGLVARYGSISASLDRFMSWRTTDGETIAPAGSALALETLARGLLSRPILLELLRRSRRLRG